MDMLKVHPSVSGAQQKKRKVPWVFIGFASSYVLLFIIVLGIGANVSSIRDDRSNLFVQTTDKTIHTKRVDPLYRSDQQLKTYAQQWFKTAYSWSPTDGIKTVGSLTYPAKLWTASYALDPGLRTGWLQQVKDRYAKQLPLEGYTTGKTQAVIELTREPNVQVVDKGVWRVVVVADRAHIKSDGSSTVEAMKITLTIEAVPPSNQQENDILGLGEDSDDLNALIHRWRQEGLKIVLVEAT